MRSHRSGRFGGGPVNRCLEISEPPPKCGNGCHEILMALAERPRQDRVERVSLIENPHSFLLGANFDTEHLNGSFKIDDHGSDYGGFS
jgi:hypothetical protein